MTNIIDQQLYVELKVLCGLTLSIEQARQRFLGYWPKSGHLESTKCHADESARWQSLPSLIRWIACQVKFLAVWGDWNIRLHLGIRGKYHSIFAGTWLLLVLTFFFPPKLSTSRTLIQICILFTEHNAIILACMYFLII